MLHTPTSYVKPCTKESIAGSLKTTSEKEQQRQISFPKVSNIIHSSECKDKLFVTPPYYEEVVVTANIFDSTQANTTDGLNLRDIGTSILMLKL